MQSLLESIDITKVQILIYHLPSGKTVAIKLKGIEMFMQLDLERGRVCDTSDIDGVVHFFPSGVA